MQPTTAGAVASYQRVSTDEQRERATIETQRVEIAAYVATHGLQLGADNSYSDDGYSGRKLHLHQRPAGARLLADAETQGIRALVVYRADRLGRGRKLLSAVDDLERAGIRTLHSVTEQPFDLRNPNDIFLLTMLSGVSGYESDGFLKRSGDAMNRLAREGVWLGGITPYGYRVVGEKREARLVVSDDEPLNGVMAADGSTLTEAGVVRLIYRWCAEDNWTCQRIADELNALGVPPAYLRDGRTEIQRQSERGRKQHGVYGIWRHGRIRSMLTNTLYMGIHRYGKRTANPEGREPIERAMPALVDADLWRRAQEALHQRMIMSPKNHDAHSPAHRYLLRGLIECGTCGLHYCGVAGGAGMTAAERDADRARRAAAGETVYRRGTSPRRYYRQFRYYKCTGSAQYRGLYGGRGQRCPSKAIQGDGAHGLETQIWTQIVAFLQHPDDLLTQLAAQLTNANGQTDAIRDSVADAKLALANTQSERDTMLALYRRGRIDEATLDRQLDMIAAEEGDLRERVGEQEALLRAAAAAETSLTSVGTLLANTRERLEELAVLEARVAAAAEDGDDGAVAAATFRLKQDMVKTFVRKVVVQTVTDEGGRRRAEADVEYSFSAAPAISIAAMGTDMRDKNCYGVPTHAAAANAAASGVAPLPAIILQRSYPAASMAAAAAHHLATVRKSPSTGAPAVDQAPRAPSGHRRIDSPHASPPAASAPRHPETDAQRQRQRHAWCRCG